MHGRRPPRSPMADWPALKVVALVTLTYGTLGAIVTGSAYLPPRFSPLGVGVVASILTISGIIFAFWSRATLAWWARLGGGAVFAAYFQLLGVRCWYAAVGGVWFIVIAALSLLSFGIAFALPGISYTISSTLWREQIAPQTKLGKSITRSAISLGLVGAGILSASVGLSLVRTGNVGTAYLLIAVLSSIVSFFVAQSLAHQLWPDRPWVSDSDSRQVTGNL
jgi:hypothetical protein